jgi:Flp pilus assembly protein TadD
LAVVIAIAAVALVGAWAIWQPLRAADAYSASVAAQLAGNTRTAFTDARTAAGDNPKSIDPPTQLAALYSFIGDQRNARAEYVRAVTLQPENPITWQQLGEYDCRQHQAHTALRELAHARLLNPSSASIIDVTALVSSRGCR